VGGKMLDFRQIKLFCLEYRYFVWNTASQSTKSLYVLKIWGRAWPPGYAYTSAQRAWQDRTITKRSCCIILIQSLFVPHCCEDVPVFFFANLSSDVFEAMEEADSDCQDDST